MKTRLSAVVVLSLLLIGMFGVVAAQASEWEKPEWWTGYNSRVSEYFVKAGYPPYEANARYIGELRGTWEEMGIQYGERAGDLVRLVWDGYYEQMIRTVGDPDLLVAEARNFADFLGKISPEAIEFMQGIAKGSEEELNKSFYAVGNSFDKVVVINHYFALRRIFNEQWTPGKEVKIVASSGKNIPEELAACSGMVVLGTFGGPTKDRTTIHSGTKDQQFFPQMYQVSYVAVPSDPNAHKFWTLSSAGEIGGQMAGNDKGVIVSGYAGANSPNYWAYGIEWNIGCWYGAAFAADLEEALEILTLGRPSYREATGRATLTPAWGINWLVSDMGDAGVVETRPGHYAIRRVGDLGEEDFIVCTNHAMADHSYDENNVLTDIPFALFGPYDGPYAGMISSGGRYWTLWWQIKYNYGNIDRDMVMGWYKEHYFIDEAGYRQDYYWLDGIGWHDPAHAPMRLTLCRHSGDSATNTDAKVGVAQDLAFYFTVGRPCEWVGPWDSISLMYSDFRN